MENPSHYTKEPSKLSVQFLADERYEQHRRDQQQLFMILYVSFLSFVKSHIDIGPQ